MTSIIVESVSEVLGLTPRGKKLEPLEFVAKLEEGLPVRSFDLLMNQVAPRDKSFSYLIVARATLDRRRHAKDKRLTVDESERLARLARIWELALKVWGSKEEARRFLFEPHMLLDGRLPAEMAARTDEGARLVEGILGRLYYGSAA